jgi:hypothetical protein
MLFHDKNHSLVTFEFKMGKKPLSFETKIKIIEELEKGVPN